MKHLQKLTETVDWNYGDPQLGTVLQNECLHKQEFKHINTGFKAHGVCEDFATSMVSARDSQLKTGSVVGFKNMCMEFYEHHGGFLKGGKKTEKKSPPPPALWGAAKGPQTFTAALTVALSALVFVV